MPFAEKERNQSWIRRQLSRQMNRDYDFDDADYPTAVAAAAYAIQSIEKSKSRHRNETAYGPGKSSNKIRSKAEDIGIQPELHKSALKFSDETSKQSSKNHDIKAPISTSTSKTMPEKAMDPAPSLNHKKRFDYTDETTSNKPGNPALERAPEHSPSVLRPSSFADKHLNISDSKSPETPSPKPDRQPVGWATTQPIETRSQSATKPGPEDSMADAWEKEEMASIKERYERLRTTIDNWEIKKKKKADQKLERTEGKSEKKEQKLRRDAAR
ncbi:hypothetical protein DH2020_032552 [Rehmannia glutinosa]|uniref:Remorin C-terminal domain-containing protein n=1 Tax=Rehmannia glutinosa TaxID=99300 RepID=A0ABR0VFE6_REHGL